MTTSGTTDQFSSAFDLREIIEEAYEMVGKEVRSGYELKTARRSLDLLMKEWGNRGINFWTIAEGRVPVAPDNVTSEFPLATDMIDVLDAVWRVGDGQAQQDLAMNRMAESDYAQMSNKNTVGMPTRYWVRRLLDPKVQLWPVPVNAGTFVYWYLRRIEDAGKYGNTMDVPPRFLPALTSGLAFYLALKTPTATDRVPMLQMEYERQFTLAAEEDRERTSLRLVPGGSYRL